MFFALFIKNIDMEFKELNEEIIEKIDKLSEEGNDLFDEDKFHQAISIWKKALALIPEPQ